MRSFDRVGKARSEPKPFDEPGPDPTLGPKLLRGPRLARARGRLLPLGRAYRFVKQARHRASRRFLNDGARSSLPQYRQTSFPVTDAAFDDRSGHRGVLVAFAV
jgi:hypothetical protein